MTADRDANFWKTTSRQWQTTADMRLTRIREVVIERDNALAELKACQERNSELRTQMARTKERRAK